MAPSSKHLIVLICSPLLLVGLLLEAVAQDAYLIPVSRTFCRNSMVIELKGEDEGLVQSSCLLVELRHLK